MSQQTTLPTRYARKQCETLPDWAMELKDRQLEGDQKTATWLAHREQMITASDAAAALGQNPYSSKQEFIDRKCSDTYGGFTGNAATAWGEYWEEIALQKYCDEYKKDVYAYNLIKHASIPWMGGSPDGITHDGILIEIKCPPNRKIKPGVENIPVYYYHQVQMLMHICNLDMCHFVQFKPRLGEFAPEAWEVTEVPKEQSWWDVNYPSLTETWNTILHRRHLINTGCDLPPVAVIDKPTVKKQRTAKPSLCQEMPCIVVQDC